VHAGGAFVLHDICARIVTFGTASRGPRSRRGLDAIGVGAIAVGLLQEFLVLAFQILFEDDAPDLEVGVLVSKASFFLWKRRVEIRVVVDLPRATDASVEGLGRLMVSLQRVRVEKVSPLGRERQSALVLAQVNQLDETLSVKVL
jgi:hypothetical protein